MLSRLSLSGFQEFEILLHIAWETHGIAYKHKNAVMMACNFTFFHFHDIVLLWRLIVL